MDGRNRCVRSCMCLLSFMIWFLGGIVLGTIMWVLATSNTYKIFLHGTLVFTYVILAVGTLLFINGILGWISSYCRATCLIKFFLFLSVLTISAELGGIVTLNVMKFKMSDVLQKAWEEVNQPTRNIVQEHFDCCGFVGPEEFVDNTDPIDDTCYLHVPHDGKTELLVVPARSLNRMGCKEKLVDWFYINKLIWIASLGLFLLLQVIVALLTVHVINCTHHTQPPPPKDEVHFRTHL